MKDRQSLHNLYNGTSTADDNGEIESYESWLEKRLLQKVNSTYEDFLEKECLRLADQLEKERELNHALEAKHIHEHFTHNDMINFAHWCVDERYTKMEGDYSILNEWIKTQTKEDES
jgi:hypothetical protein